MAVRILPSDLVNQIAAGEVVERPASVVKELVENAIDAGALALEILLENGGKKLIEVRDDGSGMGEADAGMALRRHATSKISRFDDLLTIRTLGFRGEALPSIASVSRFSLLTSNTVDGSATEVFVSSAGDITHRPAARDRGTTVSVGELFENVPARRKFLRSADAEFRSIIAVVTSYALASPRGSFRLMHHGRTVLDLPVAASLRDRILQILGPDVDQALVPVDSEVGRCRVGGFVTRGIRYGSRRNQYFFVNGRLVKDRVLTHAANRAAEAFDFDGHPAMFLFLEMPPEEVDVNVHPGKTEVRFRDSGPVHVAVEEGVRRALGGAEEGSGLLSIAEDRTPALAAAEGGFRPEGLFGGTMVTQRLELEPVANPLFRGNAYVQPPREARAGGQEAVLEGEGVPGRLGALQGRVIGQYRLSYVVMETPDGLRLVDQHVAHERVLYDRIEARFGGGGEASQRLLVPAIETFGASDAAALATHLEELRGTGFDIEAFSGNAFAIAAIPADLPISDLPRFFRKLLDASLEEKVSHVHHLRHRVIASLACQAAIKVHRPLSGEEMAGLVAELLLSSNPFACPHGRPVIVDIRHLDVEKHFHRK
jgi:DNA mismatch repair protein MutL